MSARRPRSLEVPNFARGSVGTLKEQTFQVNGPRLWNTIPNKIRNKTQCSMDEFKMDLDVFLSSVPDEPKISGQVPLNAENSNSLLHQMSRSQMGGQLVSHVA